MNTRYKCGHTVTQKFNNNFVGKQILGHKTMITNSDFSVSVILVSYRLFHLPIYNNIIQKPMVCKVVLGIYIAFNQTM